MVEIIGSKGISENIIKLIRKINKDYNLCEWKLEFWNISGENECIPDFKLIYIDGNRDDKIIKRYILHEVAHSLIPNDLESREHGKKWNDKYKELLKKYNL